MEIRTIITKLTRNKATGADNISAEFLQSLGEKGIQTMTRLMNKIYNTGNLPDRPLAEHIHYSTKGKYGSRLLRLSNNQPHITHFKDITTSDQQQDNANHRNTPVRKPAGIS